MNTDTYDVEMKNVSKYFGAFKAVDNVSVQIPKGSFFSVLGPSGSGKTTILRLLSGFEHPDEGDIILNNQVINHLPPNQRPTNLIFQNLALFPNMNVFDNVAFGLKQRRLSTSEIKNKVLNMLERTGIKDQAKKKISQLSGGQQQRVAIARSLVLDPAVLLLDEPLSALDLKLREHMRIELKEIQQRVGATFIYVTHDQEEAMAMSDNIAVMINGKIEQTGSPRELYSSPASAFVHAFVGESNRFYGVLKEQNEHYLKTKVKSLEINGLAKDSFTGPEHVLLFIRPQNILIGSDAQAAGGNYQKYDGIVKKTVFKGHFHTYLIELADGIPIKVVVPQASHIEMHKNGTTVKVAWLPEDCFCYTAKALKDINDYIG
ncbi:spermidine/putrescine transport system ATP-binding protein [Desulfotomaculum arcticum]|uniref:Spermidine/putrescine transport system ATP-binding protein n=1 Tax=Desulfotruncus arcticus DSM 17038 TaxID=1121424 RepID=A0A1I2VVY5_9FIRM|nr:ABC transporter ATP-binding protein [Desulfotruncus arcticus]SFG93172.1 spermidine/putrescine transport system ATP-binding protein [Desulfotomaculum arcticum] [Desulfotruncus arcticus DSM 17038]